jgi:hypothetical protein
MSDINSDIAENKRIILKNPDGTYTHCKRLLKKALKKAKRNQLTSFNSQKQSRRI